MDAVTQVALDSGSVQSNGPRKGCRESAANVISAMLAVLVRVAWPFHLPNVPVNVTEHASIALQLPSTQLFHAKTRTKS